MTDSRWWPFLTEFDDFHSNFAKVNKRRFLRSLITIPRSKMRNSKWRIQLVVIFDWIRSFSFKFYINEYNGGFKVTDYDFYVKNGKFKLAELILWPLLTQFEVFFIELHKHTYRRIFEVSDHDSAIKIQKFKMADWIGRPLLTKFEVYFFKLHKNAYEAGFEVADQVFEVDI